MPDHSPLAEMHANIVTQEKNRSNIGFEIGGSSRSMRRVAVELFAASFVVLFQELALIRWLPGQVRVLAYFPNLILLSAFLGLGLGCLRAGRARGGHRLP